MNFCKVMHSIMTDTHFIDPSGSSPWLVATNGLMASPYLTTAAKYTACTFGHLTSACSTPAFYRRTLESILTGSPSADRTLTFRTHTDNSDCWVTYWSLSLWSDHCSLWPLSLCSVQYSLWSLSLCSVHSSLCSTSLCSVQCSLWSLSLCGVQCSLWSLSLCSVHCCLWSL